MSSDGGLTGEEPTTKLMQVSVEFTSLHWRTECPVFCWLLAGGHLLLVEAILLLGHSMHPAPTQKERVAQDVATSRLESWGHLEICLPQILFFFFNIYLFLRDSTSRGGAERERGRHRIGSRLQALSCQHRAQCRA